MAAIVKPIEAKSVHQIQSGQVIVDLCSVVKELVENSLDASATNLEVRFKNHGLDEIEVQDNGSGIAPINYGSVALKHHTSKLSTYDDLSTLHTFGFRGEALSSLCALSNFSITTAQADEAPKGTRLEFEMSGKLKNTSVVACQKGTTATVQNLFDKLPVRRKELSKNIKREYGKVLGLLHAYACISTNVKFTVKNAVSKGKSVLVFATKSNTTTRENIANIYGAKTLSALVALDLNLDYQQSMNQPGTDEPSLTKVAVRGHISKPVFGEGRQTPDRQMFFVNGRPCGLPQIAKAINEVYKSFNVSQSPFIFADFQMDTGAYDVNVSPDKRTILLHNATAMIENLKTSLTDLFDRQDQTVPLSNAQPSKLIPFKQMSMQRQTSLDSVGSTSASLFDLERIEDDSTPLHADNSGNGSNKLLHDHFRNLASTREEVDFGKSELAVAKLQKDRERRTSKLAEILARQNKMTTDIDEYDDKQELPTQAEIEASDIRELSTAEDFHVRDFNARMAEQQQAGHHTEENSAAITTKPTKPSTTSNHQPEESGAVTNAFDRTRPKRIQPEIATIVIGDKTVTRIIGSHSLSNETGLKSRSGISVRAKPLSPPQRAFSKGLQMFSASATEPNARSETDNEEMESNLASDHEVTADGHSHNRQGVHNHLDDHGSTSGSLPASSTAHDLAIANLDSADSGDEQDERAAENKRVAELIRAAEDTAVREGRTASKRLMQTLKSGRVKDSLTSLVVDIPFDLDKLESQSQEIWKSSRPFESSGHGDSSEYDDIAGNAEERLSLTVSKDDFLNMHVVGQFNLGFILAVRPKHSEAFERDSSGSDELFIIDQHASDEKFNFERLQAETVVGNQRMVRPAVLDLTAVEEEILIDNTMALEKNGFIVDIDTSGKREIGKRCYLVSLPLSKEVVFGTKDLDELIHLLAESPMLNESSFVPRPSKVRKMFAMRACRSSIMIGKTLSRKQMSTVLHHMGAIDKPWNCPHGRPTMRHLASLDTFEASLWKEGDGVYTASVSFSSGSKSASDIWRNYAG